MPSGYYKSVVCPSESGCVCLFICCYEILFSVNLFNDQNHTRKNSTNLLLFKIKKRTYSFLESEQICRYICLIKKKRDNKMYWADPN